MKGLSRSDIIVLVIGIFILIICINGLLIINHHKPRVVHRSTSPDNSWTIVVIAKKQFLDKYEVTVEIRDAQDFLADNGEQVIGSEYFMRDVRNKYIVEFAGDKAYVGKNCVLSKSDFIK